MHSLSGSIKRLRERTPTSLAASYPDDDDDDDNDDDDDDDVDNHDNDEACILYLEVLKD